MSFGIKAAALFLALTVSASAQEKTIVDIYTSLPVSGSGGQIAVGITKILNSVQDKREYKLGVIQGAQGDTSALRALTDAKQGKNVVLYNGLSMYTFNRVANPTSEFDRDKDFITSVGIGKNHYAIMVNKDSDVKTLEQLIVKIKSKPESFMAATLTSPGAIMLNDMFVKKFNLNVKQINYKTPAEIVLAVQNKEVDYTVFTVPDMQQLHALAVSSAERLKTFPEAPTARELKFPEFETSSILLFSVPRENGRFLTTFEEDMKKVCSSPDFEMVAKLRSPYLSYCLNPKEVKAVVDAENALINKTLKK